MRNTVKKAVGICVLGTILFLGKTDFSYAINIKGTDAEAGASMVLEKYYKENSMASKQALQNVSIVTASTVSLIQEPIKEETKTYAPIPGYTNLGIANVQDSLNVRKSPVDGEIIGRILKDGACEIISEENGWYYIESGDITGYVSADYVLTGDAALEKAWEAVANVAKVTADALYLRQEPNTECDILEVLGNSEEFEVVEILDGWAKILVDSTEGYVSTDYVSISPQLETARTLEQLQYGMGVSDLRIEMVNFAQQFVGYPYVYGGNSLTKGTDCSGFTYLIYQHFGISIPRTATTQYNFGKKINISELKPGDLIIYGESQIEHVGMYIGNGQIVHASSARTGIKYSQMYYRNIIGCVRILND